MAPARFSFLVFLSLFIGLIGRSMADEWSVPVEVPGKLHWPKQ